MTSRAVARAVLDDLERGSAIHAPLAFLEVRHPNLAAPIRVVSDPVDHVWQGLTWTGLVFGFRLLSEGDAAPSTEIVLQNTDRRIGAALRASRQRAEIALSVLSTADFDLAATPRTEIGTAAPIYAFSRFELVDVTADAVELRGRVFLRDFAQEPWPGIVATQSRLPGLFR